MAAWISVLVNSKEVALMKAFNDNGHHGRKVTQGFLYFQPAIIRYVLPGNDCLATIAAPTVVLITVCYYCDYHFWGDIVGMLECVFKCR